MNQLPVLLLLAVLWLVTFAPTQFAVLHDWIGVPLNLSPALLVYTALTHGPVLTTVVSVMAGLWLDALSASRFGVSLLPMFLFAFVVQSRSHLILRDQRFAQFWLGVAGGILIPIATAGVLLLGRREPALTQGTVAQLILLGVANGLATPLTFQLFDRMNRAFNYQSLEPGSFRADRQIVRSRHQTRTNDSFRQ